MAPFFKAASILSFILQFREYGYVRGEMRRIYLNGKVCAPRMFPGTPRTSDRCLPMEPDLKDLMAKSRDANELLWAWQGWRDAVGRPMKDLYPIYVNLSNEAAMSKGILLKEINLNYSLLYLYLKDFLNMCQVMIIYDRNYNTKIVCFTKHVFHC